MENAEFISTRQAAERLGVALRTVQLWVENGTLTAWKTAGGHRRVTASSVEALLARRRQILGLPAQATRSEAIVLVVEDDLDLMQLYELHLAGWELPLQVHTARNGFEGLIKLGELKPDILITDLNMPGIDGFRMLRMVAASPDFARMLTVAVTALSPADVSDRGGVPDGVSLLTKPAPFSTLEEMVRRHVLSLNLKPKSGN